MIRYRCFLSGLHRHLLGLEPENHTWDPGTSWSMPQPGGELPRGTLGQPPHYPPPRKKSNPSWRSDPNQVRVHHGLKEQSTLKMLPRSYTNYVLGVLPIHES